MSYRRIKIMEKLEEYMAQEKSTAKQIYFLYHYSIWQIINDNGGILEFLKGDCDTQYIADHNTFIYVITSMALDTFDYIKYEYKKRELVEGNELMKIIKVGE